MNLQMASFYQTIDGGVYWNEVEGLGKVTQSGGIQFIGDFGLLQGAENGTLYRTFDAGTTWEKVVMTDEKVYAFELFENGLILTSNRDAYFISNDYGNTWIRRDSPEPEILHFINEKTGLRMELQDKCTDETGKIFFYRKFIEQEANNNETIIGTKVTDTMHFRSLKRVNQQESIGILLNAVSINGIILEDVVVRIRRRD